VNLGKKVFIVVKGGVSGGDNWSCKMSSQIVTTNKPTPNILRAGCPSRCPSNSVKALKRKHIVRYTFPEHLQIYVASNSIIVVVIVLLCL